MALMLSNRVDKDGQHQIDQFWFDQGLGETVHVIAARKILLKILESSINGCVNQRRST
jgi:hypothetical protein